VLETSFVRFVYFVPLFFVRLTFFVACTFLSTRSQNKRHEVKAHKADEVHKGRFKHEGMPAGMPH
jgi:preprotein translocase subunit YajC